MTKIVASNNAKQTKKFAGEIIKSLKCNLLCLYGDLGSGKTTFTQGIAEYFGIKRLISPTFVIMRRYDLEKSKVKRQNSKVSNQNSKVKHLYHIDLYRLENINEIKAIGIEEVWNDPENLVVVEWAERAKDILPKQRVDICFEYIGDDKRKITVF